MRTRSQHLVLALTAALLLASCGGAAPSQSYSAAAPTAAPNQRQQSAPESIAQPAPTAAPGSEAPRNDIAAVAAPPEMAAAEPTFMPPIAESVPLAPFTSTAQDHLSTFAMDVDTASYSFARAIIQNGGVPNPSSVRIEEFVNSFRYRYTPPSDQTFAIHMDSAVAPYGRPGTQIVRVGIQGRVIEAAQRQPAQLTFVIDVSGSMQEPNRLPLVKESLKILLDQLRPDDKVAVVVYGSNARIALEPTSLDQKQQILDAINTLGDEGSTNVEAGLQVAYQLASKRFLRGASNRIILCSDGVANVGNTGPEAILSSIRQYADQGIYLTTVGFGMDYNDPLMEQLANDGNGNYAYVDTIKAAERVFAESLTGTIQVIARDAKVQVDFNPAVVAEYRLLGYENRAVADSDFRNDQVDAGEIGAGHAVTALYEVRLNEQAQGNALTVQLRWAAPQGEVRELSQSINSTAFGGSFEQSPTNMQLAVTVAAFAAKLRNDPAAPTFTQILGMLTGIEAQFANDPDIAELHQLIQRMTLTE
ncbi:MAG: hypothetical protein Fur005_01850 [Roseiflexaceae bacterium]